MQAPRKFNQSAMSQRKRKLKTRFDFFVDCYFNDNNVNSSSTLTKCVIFFLQNNKLAKKYDNFVIFRDVLSFFPAFWSEKKFCQSDTLTVGNIPFWGAVAIAPEYTHPHERSGSQKCQLISGSLKCQLQICGDFSDFFTPGQTFS